MPKRRFPSPEWWTNRIDLCIDRAAVTGGDYLSSPEQIIGKMAKKGQRATIKTSDHGLPTFPNSCATGRA